MQTLDPITVLVGISSFFSFLITLIQPFFGTTCTGLTQGLSDMAYINPAFSHLRTSFFTTSFIIGFNLLYCSIEVLAFSSIRILCIQINGLIPFKSSIDQAMASLCFLRISTTFFFFSTVKFATKISGFDYFSPRNTNFKCLGNSFKISPS